MTALEIKPQDHLREAALHSYADLRVAINMRHDPSAWKKIEQAYVRLEAVLAPQEEAKVEKQS